jgi:hypothetical protein
MSQPSVFREPRFRLGAVVAIAVAAGLVAWLLLRDNGSSSSNPVQVAGASATTQAKLADLAAAVQHPIFWLGPMRGFTYELSQTGSGKIYVRYLPHGVDVGVDKPYLTVATYPFPGAYPAVKKQAAAKGAVTARLGNGGLALLDNGYPQSVHIAYPGVNYQIEVYAPAQARAMQLVSSGRLRHLGRLKASPQAPATLSAKPTAASVRGLKSLANELGHPIYWAGARRGYRYELSRTTSGNVFIRYLPAGAKVGDPRARYLTVATYPFPGAFAAVAKAAGGAATIKLAHGGIGVVDGAYPKSIHVAYPGVAYQIEVYNPSPSAGRKLVASGAISPVP